MDLLFIVLISVIGVSLLLVGVLLTVYVRNYRTPARKKISSTLPTAEHHISIAVSDADESMMEPADLVSPPRQSQGSSEGQGPHSRTYSRGATPQSQSPPPHESPKILSADPPPMRMVPQVRALPSSASSSPKSIPSDWFRRDEESPTFSEILRAGEDEPPRSPINKRTRP